MFGRKKKPQKPSKLASIIGANIQHSMNEPHESTQQVSDLPFLPRGMRNNRISQEEYFALPWDWRRYWHRLDLDYIFSQEDEEESEIDKIANTEVNIPLLSKEKKIQLKAIEFGMTADDIYSKQVGL